MQDSMEASVDSPSNSGATPSTIHPEDAELISQLAKLQQMHHQIHHLRSLLPTALIGPARAALSQQERTSPQNVAEAVLKAARQGSLDIREFQKTWHDEKTRQLFKDANAADTPQGVDSWMVDYASLMKSASINTTQPVEDSPKDESFDTPKQAHDAIQEATEDKKSYLKLASGSETDKFPVTISLDRMTFSINNDQAPRTYTIKAASDHRLAQQISDYLTEKGSAGSGVWRRLDELLNMLNNYHNAESSRCVKCNSIVDDNLDYALARLPVTEKNSDGESETKWKAYHASCSAK